MMKIKVKMHYSASKKKAVEDAILETMTRKGVVVSNAKTAKEICATISYNRSIEIPICGKGKLECKKKIQVWGK